MRRFRELFPPSEEQTRRTPATREDVNGLKYRVSASRYLYTSGFRSLISKHHSHTRLEKIHGKEEGHFNVNEHQKDVHFIL